MKHKIDLDMNENEDIINLEERSRIAEQNNISQNDVNNRNSHIVNLSYLVKVKAKGV